MPTVVVQGGYRIRTDATAAQGGTPVWAAAEDNDVVVPANIPFRIRFWIGNEGGVGSPNVSTASTKYIIQHSKDGGATYQTGGDLVGADATFGGSADGQQLTTSLLSGASGGYTYSVIGQYCSTGTTAFAVSVPYAGYVEFEFGLQFISPGCDGNTYLVRAWPLSPGTDAFGTASEPTFVMGHSASLAQTEADDTLTAAGNIPRAARLDAIEVGDNLTGSAVAVNNAALTQTEGNDTLLGSAYQGFVAYLTQTEADDSLIGVGSVTGVVSSLSVIEDDDALVSATLLWANQWIEVEDCPPSMWTPVDCGESLPPFPPVVPPGGGGGGEVTTVMELTMEQLPVLSLNQIGNFSHTPNMELCTLTVDGRPFFPVGSPPDFSVSGSSITWLSSIYSVDPSSTVIAQYSWTSNG